MRMMARPSTMDTSNVHLATHSDTAKASSSFSSFSNHRSSSSLSPSDTSTIQSQKRKLPLVDPAIHLQCLKKIRKAFDSDVSNSFGNPSYSLPEVKVLQHLISMEESCDRAMDAARQAVQEAKTVTQRQGERVCLRFKIRYVPPITMGSSGFLYSSSDISSSAMGLSTSASLQGQGIGNSNAAPMWSMTVAGRALASGMDGALTEHDGLGKVSHYIKRIFVQFGEGGCHGSVEWCPSEAADGFTVRRGGREGASIKMFIYLEYNPPRYQLSAALSKLLKVTLITRTNVLLGLLAYVKLHNLVDPQDKKKIKCDSLLAEVFQTNELDLSRIGELLRPHLTTPDPIEIKMDVKTSENNIYSGGMGGIGSSSTSISSSSSSSGGSMMSSNVPCSSNNSNSSSSSVSSSSSSSSSGRGGIWEECYDIMTDIPVPFVADEEVMEDAGDDRERLEIQRLEEEILAKVKAIDSLRTEWLALGRFRQDPVGQIQSILASQLRDYKVFMATVSAKKN